MHKNYPIAPGFLQEWWQKEGADEQNPIFAQVATVGEGEEPQVRTVHVRYLKERGCLGINTHVGSRKWQALTKNPLLAGCYYDVARQRQIRWKGTVELIKGDKEEEKGFLDSMWALIDEEVRIGYWIKEGLAKQDPNIRCPTLGSILCKPTSWDIYEINRTNHLKSHNSIYFFNGTEWETEDAPSLPLMAKKM